MQIFLGLFLALSAIYLYLYQPETPPPINTRPVVKELLQPIKTNSRFASKRIEETRVIAREVSYKDDPDSEIGSENTLDEGADGKEIKTVEITYYQGEEYGREVVKIDVVPPKSRVVARGTKIVWRTMDTPDGQINYWRKLHVWATHYDSHCPGCGVWTATGMRQGKGVIAVDPAVIKLGSKVYVPGYGAAVAGDTGGAIKGNIIDLGFDDAKTAGWFAHFVDIYLL